MCLNFDKYDFWNMLQKTLVNRGLKFRGKIPLRSPIVPMQFTCFDLESVLNEILFYFSSSKGKILTYRQINTFVSN